MQSSVQKCDMCLLAGLQVSLPQTAPTWGAPALKALQRADSGVAAAEVVRDGLELLVSLQHRQHTGLRECKLWTARTEALKLTERLCLMPDPGVPPNCQVVCHQKVLLVKPSFLSSANGCAATIDGTLGGSGGGGGWQVTVHAAQELHSGPVTLAAAGRVACILSKTKSLIKWNILYAGRKWCKERRQFHRRLLVRKPQQHLQSQLCTGSRTRQWLSDRDAPGSVGVMTTRGLFTLPLSLTNGQCRVCCFLSLRVARFPQLKAPTGEQDWLFAIKCTPQTDTMLIFNKFNYQYCGWYFAVSLGFNLRVTILDYPCFLWTFSVLIVMEPAAEFAILCSFEVPAGKLSVNNALSTVLLKIFINALQIQR